jgi:hypothetical protein
MTTAVADAIAATIAATAVAAFPGGLSLPALAVPAVFGVIAAALAHPRLVFEKQLTAAASTRVAVPALPSCRELPKISLRHSKMTSCTLLVSTFSLAVYF